MMSVERREERKSSQDHSVNRVLSLVGAQEKNIKNNHRKGTMEVDQCHLFVFSVAYSCHVDDDASLCDVDVE